MAAVFWLKQFSKPLWGSRGDFEATTAAPGQQQDTVPKLTHLQTGPSSCTLSKTPLVQNPADVYLSAFFKLLACATSLLFHQRLYVLFGDIICQHMQFVIEKQLIKE